VGVVTLFLSVTMFTASMLVYIMSSVARPSIIDEALLNGHRLLASRRWLLVDSYLSLVLSRLRALFCGCPTTYRG
jgi:hypothetical protein